MRKSRVKNAELPTTLDIDSNDRRQKKEASVPWWKDANV